MLDPGLGLDSFLDATSVSQRSKILYNLLSSVSHPKTPFPPSIVRSPPSNYFRVLLLCNDQLSNFERYVILSIVLQHLTCVSGLFTGIRQDDLVDDPPNYMDLGWLAPGVGEFHLRAGQGSE